MLGIEWATQRPYLESVRDDAALDPQFKSLLKHHWLEESQHAKLDALVFEEMAAHTGPEDLTAAVEDFLAIGGFVDAIGAAMPAGRARIEQVAPAFC